MDDPPTSGSPLFKKKKLFSRDVSITLSQTLKGLWNDWYSVCPFTIRSSDGDTPACFTDAIINIDESFRTRFRFPSFFQHGIKLLHSVLKERDVRLTEDETVAFQKLQDAFENLESIGGTLQELQNMKTESRNKTALVLCVVHHLLVPLSFYQNFALDDNSRVRTSKYSCKEVVCVEFVDTSMGHEKVWHGSVDILIGKNKVAVSVEPDNIEEQLEKDRDLDENLEPFPSFETKDETSVKNSKSQLIAKAVVFGFLHMKYRPCASNHLIPLIGISKEHVRIVFYDPEFDVLFQTIPWPLFADGQLIKESLLVLWFVINYTFTCSGLTKPVINTGIKADFLKHFSEDVKLIYLKDLRFCNCRRKEKLDEECNKLAAGPYFNILGDPLKDKVLKLSEDDVKEIFEEEGNN